MSICKAGARKRPASCTLLPRISSASRDPPRRRELRSPPQASRASQAAISSLQTFALNDAPSSAPLPRRSGAPVTKQPLWGGARIRCPGGPLQYPGAAGTEQVHNGDASMTVTKHKERKRSGDRVDVPSPCGHGALPTDICESAPRVRIAPSRQVLSGGRPAWRTRGLAPCARVCPRRTRRDHASGWHELMAAALRGLNPTCSQSPSSERGCAD